MHPFSESILGFIANLAIAIVIVRFIYYSHKPERNYVFAFFMLNSIVFFVMRLLNTFEIGLGAGFGLFAIFSILRYRTNTIPIREMTYLFVLIALPVVNSTLLGNAYYTEFATTNLALIAVLYVLEKGWGFHYKTRKTITYERIELIRPENWSELMEDLRTRTGLPITYVEIGRLNFLRDTAEINVYYDARMMKSTEVSIAEDNIILNEDTD